MDTLDWAAHADWFVWPQALWLERGRVEGLRGFKCVIAVLIKYVSVRILSLHNSMKFERGWQTVIDPIDHVNLEKSSLAKCVQQHRQPDHRLAFVVEN
jgi:hypothetical protein